MEPYIYLHYPLLQSLGIAQKKTMSNQNPPRHDQSVIITLVKSPHKSEFQVPKLPQKDLPECLPFCFPSKSPGYSNGMDHVQRTQWQGNREKKNKKHPHKNAVVIRGD